MALRDEDGCAVGTLVCVTAPVGHPFGPLAAFLQDPVFQVEADSCPVDAVLSIDKGPNGGRLIGNTSTPRRTQCGTRKWQLCYECSSVTKAGVYVLRCTAGDLVAATPPFTVARSTPFTLTCELPDAVAAGAAAVVAVTTSWLFSSPWVLHDATARYASAQKLLHMWCKPAPFTPPVANPVLENTLEHIRRDVTRQFQGDGSQPTFPELDAVLQRDLLEAAEAEFESLRKHNLQAASKCPALAPHVAERQPPPALLVDMMKVAKGRDITETGGRAVPPEWKEGATALAGFGLLVRIGVNCCSSANVDVQAAVVVLDEASLHLPGCSVTIACHTLVVPKGGCEINVSGLHATKDHQPGEAAAAGALLGHEGMPGDAGSDGGSAGNVALTCHRVVGGVLKIVARGGNGGRGQDGGNGAPGAIGPCGGSGGAGGNGGRAGPSGRAGDGGKIQVEVVDPSSIKRISVTSSPGAVAPAAKGGDGGLGGSAGPPARTLRYHSWGWWWNRGHDIDIQKAKEGERGVDGRHGEDGKEGERGKPNAAIVCAIPIHYLWGHGVGKAVTGCILRWAEDLYVHGDKEATLQLLDMVLASAAVQAKAGKSVAPLTRRAQLLRLQLTAGYDYWGYARCYHPLDTFVAIRDSAIPLLRGYIEIYDRRQAAGAEASKHQSLVKKARGAVTAAMTMLSLNKTVLMGSLKTAEQLHGELARLTTDLMEAIQVLRLRTDHFTEALMKEASRQTLQKFEEAERAERYSKALTVLSTAFSLAPGLPPSPSVIEALVAQGRGVEEATAAYIKIAQDSLFALGAQLASVAQQFYRDSDSMRQKTEEALTNVLMEAQSDKSELPVHEIDRWVAQSNLHGPASKVKELYLSAFRHYQMMYKARAEKVERLDAMNKQIAAVRGEVDRAEEEVATAKSALAAQVAAAESNTTSLLELTEACTDAHRTLCWKLQLAGRALLRDTLAVPPTSVVDHPSPSAVQAVLLRLETWHARVKPSRRNPLVITLRLEGAEFTEGLRSKGSWSFAIDKDMFPGKDDVRVTSVSVAVESDSDLPSLTLTHTGHAALVPTHGDCMTFTHDPLPLHLALAGNKGATEVPVGCITPFAFWRLAVPDHCNAVDIEFKGSHL